MEETALMVNVYGVEMLWTVDWKTGKISMTPDEVMESVKAVIEDEKRKYARELAVSELEKMQEKLHGGINDCMWVCETIKSRISELRGKELT